MSDDGATRIGFEDLALRIAAILVRHGVSARQAGPVARTIAAGERDGARAHGIYRIEGVLRTIEAGKIAPDAVPVLAADDGTAIVRVDAAHGFSNAAFEVGLPALAERSRRLGLAALVVNDGTHFAALWPEVEAVAEQGLAAIAMCPSYAAVAPFGGTTALIGTNPLAFAFPRKAREPYVFDFATSAAARGEIEIHRRAGRALPEGWAVDADGRPTTDPDAALAGALLPFGGHKGSALGTMIELLAGIMIGDLTSGEALDRLGSLTLLPAHGELVIAFSPERFSAGRSGDPFARVEALLDAILGQGARLPSQRRFSARKAATERGIPLTGEDVALLRRLAGD